MNPAIYTPCLSPFSLQSATVSILPSPKQASIVNRSNERATPSLFRSLGYFSLHLKEYVRSCVRVYRRVLPVSSPPAREGVPSCCHGRDIGPLARAKEEATVVRPPGRTGHSLRGRKRASGDTRAGSTKGSQEK